MSAALAGLRQALLAAARAGEPVTYLALADRLMAGERHRIHRLTLLLEDLAREDAAAGRPPLSLLATGRAGLPGRGFFELARELGLWQGEEAAAWYAEALRRALDYWRARG